MRVTIKIAIILFASLCFLRCGSNIGNRDINPVNGYIRQSNQIIEDNVNGRISAIGNLIESSNFYYNAEGLLNKIIVLNDTNNSGVILKKVEFDYQPEYVHAHTYITGSAERDVYFYFNSKKQITRLVDINGNGLYINYTNDLITAIRDSSSAAILDYKDFVYNGNNDLLNYQLYVNGGIQPIGRADLEYSRDTILPELDTRFYNRYINFIYLGGLNVVRKCGLNFGIDNLNTLIKRTETNLITNTVNDIYDFGYIYDTENRIVKRNIRRSNEDTLFYRFKY